MITKIVNSLDLLL
uniref:Uncharacterized protein n=1 Tax=Anguilla anguilla TaxID=7936 RepID=A0A0E9RNP9_ANGAN